MTAAQAPFSFADRPVDFSVVPAAYLVLTREGPAGPEVLLQLRGATGYMEQWWACGAAGHVEFGESTPTAVCREASEELGLTIDPADLTLLAVVHRGCMLGGPIEQRMDLFFTTSTVLGEPRIAETDKALELAWFPLSDLPERVVPHERQALEHLASGHPPAVLTRGLEQTLTLVAAVGRNGVIGDGSAMPWHLPADLAFFKATTMGGVLVMGRGTWDSIGRALPGRRTIVVTRDRTWAAPGAEVAHSLPEALLIAGDTEVFIAGGGQVYEQTIAVANRLVITEVDLEPEGPVTFPQIDLQQWHEESRRTQDGLAWVEYRR